MLRNDQWCARTWNILHSTHRCLVRSEDRGYRSWCRRGCRRRSAADRRSAARRNNGTTAQPAKRSDRHQRHWRHRQCRWWMSVAVPVPPNAPHLGGSAIYFQVAHEPQYIFTAGNRQFLQPKTWQQQQKSPTRSRLSAESWCRREAASWSASGKFTARRTRCRSTRSRPFFQARARWQSMLFGPLPALTAP